jgi:hypothetical protein
MRLSGIITISLLFILLTCILSCAEGSNNGAPSTTPALSPTVTPSVSPTISPTASPTFLATPTATLGPEGCEPDRDAIQAAINAYHADNGNWPTTTTFGEPGNIKWSVLVPDYLPYIPHTDARCDWQVNTDPEGEVCLWELC